MRVLLELDDERHEKRSRGVSPCADVYVVRPRAPRAASGGTPLALTPSRRSGLFGWLSGAATRPRIWHPRAGRGALSAAASALHRRAPPSTSSATRCAASRARREARAPPLTYGMVPVGRGRGAVCLSDALPRHPRSSHMWVWPIDIEGVLRGSTTSRRAMSRSTRSAPPARGTTTALSASRTPASPSAISSSGRKGHNPRPLMPRRALNAKCTLCHLYRHRSMRGSVISTACV